MEEGFVKALFGEDDLGVVLRANIYLEAKLLELLELLVKDQTHLRKLRLDYSQQIDLAVTLGLGWEHASGLRAFGKLRNEFAHKLDSKLSQQRIKSLYESFSSSDKQVIQGAYLQTKSRLGGFGGEDVDFGCLDPKKKLILIASTLYGMLEAAISQVKRGKVKGVEEKLSNLPEEHHENE